jgi:hypothetical protein
MEVKGGTALAVPPFVLLLVYVAPGVVLNARNGQINDRKERRLPKHCGYSFPGPCTHSVYSAPRQKKNAGNERKLRNGRILQGLDPPFPPLPPFPCILFLFLHSVNGCSSHERQNEQVPPKHYPPFRVFFRPFRAFLAFGEVGLPLWRRIR